MLGNRNSQHNFAQIPKVNMARSQFDRSHAAKDTMNFDYLNPIFIDEIIPGDTLNLNLNMFARLATQKVPIMDNMSIDFFFFFVPNRLLWSNWEKFNGAQDNPGDSTSFVIPHTTTTAVTGEAVGSLADKLGIPTGVPGLQVNSLPFRMYYLCWNTWFRDQNLQNSLTVPTGDGPDTIGNFVLQKRGKRHDYFTSALPWPQKGTAVSMPLGVSAPVKVIPSISYPVSNSQLLETSGGGAYAGTVDTNASGNLISAGTHNAYIALSDDTHIADLSAATAPTINSLRQAFMVQSLLELDARGGTRYVEILQAHFNVTSPDFRLSRPEYIGGGKVTINSHPVPQTSPTSGSNAQAQLASFATASTQGQSVGFTKSFVEHGYVIGLACPRGEITYQQGLNRMWSRSTRYDFFWPKLQELGEQAILNKEIYAVGSGGSTDDNVFGYQERYAEYRYKPSEIRGQFRSTYSTPLDFWHLAEEFGSLPALNSTFITQTTPIDRAIAVAGVHLITDMWFQLKHARPMMTYSVPASLGRF